MENRTGDYVERIRTGAYSPTEKESDSFDKVDFICYELLITKCIIVQ